MRRATWAYKLSLFVLYAVAYAFFYLWPNFRPLYVPTQLPLLEIDRAMPLVPWTFWVYLSDYLLFAVAFCLVNDLDEWNSFARLAFGALICCGLVFILYPTTYPRPVYPIVANPVVAFAMNLIATADTPNNCFPSMHVAMTSVALWGLRRKARSVFAFFGLWTVAIFLSTLTTKQHYLADILGGLFVVTVLAWLDRIFVSRGLSENLAKAFSTRRTP